MNQQPGQLNPEDEERILEHMPYLSELMHAIRDINQALIQEGDAIDAAENLLSDLPEDWELEVSQEINDAKQQYLKDIKSNNKSFSAGTLGSVKKTAWLRNHYTGKQYARQIKRIVVTLLKKKGLLFQTKKQVEQGYLSLYQLGEGEIDE